MTVSFVKLCFDHIDKKVKGNFTSNDLIKFARKHGKTYNAIYTAVNRLWEAGTLEKVGSAPRPEGGGEFIVYRKIEGAVYNPKSAADYVFENKMAYLKMKDASKRIQDFTLSL